jgi:type II secretory pathway pseudopilin PulG
LIELLVSMLIFSVVMAGVYTVLITVWRQTSQQTARADAVGEARLALAEIDRQVRSGNVLYDTTADPLSMLVYTQANNDRRCMQWQVASGVLRSRSWAPPPPSTPPAASPWAVVARNVVNTTSTPAFTLQTAAYGSRLVDISLLVEPTRGSGPPIAVTSSLSGRNTAYGYDQGVCGPAPTP